MYSQVEVIYGVPVTTKIYRYFQKTGEEYEDYGGVSLYSGRSETIPGYFGISLGTFDEARNSLQVVQLVNGTVTLLDTENKKFKQIHLFTSSPIKDTITQQAKEIIENLPEDLQKILPPIGVYFVFHTS